MDEKRKLSTYERLELMRSIVSNNEDPISIHGFNSIVDAVEGIDICKKCNDQLLEKISSTISENPEKYEGFRDIIIECHIESLMSREIVR